MSIRSVPPERAPGRRRPQARCACALRAAAAKPRGRPSPSPLHRRRGLRRRCAVRQRSFERRKGAPFAAHFCMAAACTFWPCLAVSARASARHVSAPLYCGSARAAAGKRAPRDPVGHGAVPGGSALRARRGSRQLRVQAATCFRSKRGRSAPAAPLADAAGAPAGDFCGRQDPASLCRPRRKVSVAAALARSLLTARMRPCSAQVSRGRLQAAPQCSHARPVQAMQEHVLQGALLPLCVLRARAVRVAARLTARATAADHTCMRLSGGLSRSASAPQLTKGAPKTLPGVLVSATAAPKVKAEPAGPQAPQKVCLLGVKAPHWL